MGLKSLSKSSAKKRPTKVKPPFSLRAIPSTDCGPIRSGDHTLHHHLRLPLFPVREQEFASSFPLQQQMVGRPFMRESVSNVLPLPAIHIVAVCVSKARE